MNEGLGFENRVLNGTSKKSHSQGIRYMTQGIKTYEIGVEGL